MSATPAQRARSFGGWAQAYDLARPGYPDAALAWLLPPGAQRVLDVGAGTGKLTAALVARGLEVVAVEPDPQMLAVLREHHPGLQAFEATAEELPLSAAEVDCVLAGQAWHWFDHAPARAEFRRVLRPGGWVGLVWNVSAATQGWQHEVDALMPDFRADEADWSPPDLTGAGVERHDVPWSQEVTPAELRAEYATHSAVALLPRAERELLLDQAERLVRAEADRRGRATVELQRLAACFRVRP